MRACPLFLVSSEKVGLRELGLVVCEQFSTSLSCLARTLPRIIEKILFLQDSNGLAMSKRKYWLATLGLLTTAVICVIFILTYLLFTLPVPDEPVVLTPRRPALSLPTAPPPTVRFGPRPPRTVKFIAEEPVKGFSSCRAYGFKGTVTAADREHLAGVQVVAWEAEAGGLLAIGDLQTNGTYAIQIEAKPARHNVWIQVYQNDIPVSEPLLLETQVDCQAGFQIYEVDWRHKE
jgi:hypothetical protein